MSNLNQALKRRIVLFIVILLLLVIAGMYYASKEMTVTGFSPLTGKTVENGSYYLYLLKENNSVRLKCTEELYSEVTADPDLAYHISYRWNEFFPDKGKLIFLEPENTIDNR